MASLLILDGDCKGKYFLLKEQADVSLGRDDECTVQIIDPLISRKHLLIRLDSEDGRHYAGDFRSANGVEVNGRQIVKEVRLMDGDRLRIGSTSIAYLAEDHADANAALQAVDKKGEWKRSTLLRE